MGRKGGHIINSERRFGLVKKVAKTPGQALSDFNIFKLIAHYWGCSHLFQGWTSPENIFQILKKLSAGQPCDISGITDYRAIDEAGGVQWPCVGMSGDTKTVSERRLFEDGVFFHPDGRAVFLVEDPRPAPEVPCAEYPFTLLTGRGTSSQWHTQSRTAKSAVLRKLAPAKPAAYTPDWATSLNNLASFQSETGDREGALETAREAVGLRRKLAQANPAAYTPDWATSLCVLAIVCASGGRLPDGIVAAGEAVALLEPFAEQSPAAFGGLLQTATQLRDHLLA